MNITFQGNPVTLEGNPLKVGDLFPDFTLRDPQLNSVKRNDLTGIKVFATVPSLDTGVCDMEIKNLQKKAKEYGNISIYSVSMDLPFAQARWCGANGVDAVKTLSDYADHSFGKDTGTLIQDLCLLTRAVFLVDQDNRIAYVEYVPEITEHPNYDALSEAARKLAA